MLEIVQVQAYKQTRGTIVEKPATFRFIMCSANRILTNSIRCRLPLAKTSGSDSNTYEFTLCGYFRKWPVQQRLIVHF